MTEQTLEFDGEIICVRFWYQPFEPPESGPEARYPGCAESVEIDTIEDVDGRDITDEFSDEDKERLVEVLLTSE